MTALYIILFIAYIALCVYAAKKFATATECGLGLGIIIFLVCIIFTPLIVWIIGY